MPVDAVVVPRGSELAAVQRGVGRARSASPRIIDVPLGEGAAAAVRAALAQAPVASVAIVGMCGLLDPNANAGDVFVFDEVVDATGEVLACDPALNARLLEIEGVAPSRRLLTWHAIVARASDKRELGALYFATAVDMESHAILRVLRDAGVPAGVIRVGSDDARSDIPDLNPAIQPDGSLNPTRMGLAMLLAPRAAWTLSRSSLRALRTIESIGAALSG